MKISECILTRRSIRNFKDDPIPFNDLIKILEAGRWSPSAGNRQRIRFVLITDEELLKNVSNHVKLLFWKQKHAAQARAIIAICTATNTWIEEIGAAIQNMLLMAWELGIGTCWIGAFNRKKIRELAKIPEKYKVLALILLGYPKFIPKPTPRLDLRKIAFLNQWKNPVTTAKSSGILPKSGILSIVMRGFHNPQKNSPLRDYLE